MRQLIFQFDKYLKMSQFIYLFRIFPFYWNFGAAFSDVPILQTPS